MIWTKAVFMILAFLPTAYGAIDSYIFSDSERKISLKNPNENWIFLDSKDYITQNSLFIAKPLNQEGVSLSFRADKGQWSSAKKYAEKWLKDYPKFGFELQLSQENTYGDLKGFEMELTNQNKKIRQFIFLNNQEAWIFTCTGASKDFSATLKSCQNILSTAKLLLK